MKIYTKQGDAGETGLVNGQRVSKSHLRIEAYGTVDELNSHIGVLHALLRSADAQEAELGQWLRQMQNWLFQLGSQLACADESMAKQLPTITSNEIQSLEKMIDQMDGELPTLRNFILPGGDLSSAQAHVCRTVARRAERLCVALQESTPLPYPAVAFLNRLSDFFFVASRSLNSWRKCSTPEWKA